MFEILNIINMLTSIIDSIQQLSSGSLSFVFNGSASSSPKKICPFMAGGQIPGGGPLPASITMSGSQCIGDRCQLWVANTQQNQGVYPTDDAFTIITGKPSPYAKTTDANKEGGRCGLQTADYSELLYRLLHHMHRGHEHYTAHITCGQTTDDCGVFPYYTRIPKANSLLSEMINNEDMDGNNLIYAMDFSIADTSSKPLILKGLEEGYGLTRSPNLITWENYLDHVYPPWLYSVLPNKFDPAGGTRFIMLGAFFTGNLDNFDIKFNGVSATEIHIENDRMLYATAPASLDGTDSNVDIVIELTNSGYTIPTGKLIDLLLGTGGTTTWNNMARYEVDVDNDELEDRIREQESASVKYYINVECNGHITIDGSMEFYSQMKIEMSAEGTIT